MAFYLATFKPGQTDQKAFDEKLQFWKGMIENYCEFKRSARVSVQELKHVFKRYGTTPCCLQDVISRMLAEGSVIDEDKFMQQPKSFFEVWVNNLFVKPLKKGVEMITETLITKTNNEHNMFIVISAVMLQSQYLLNHIERHSWFNQIISMDDLTNEDIEGLSQDGIVPVLHYLSSASKKLSIEVAGNQSESKHPLNLLLKFFGPCNHAIPITEVERSIFSLEQTEKLLLRKIERLEQIKKEILEKARKSVHDGNKELAKIWLRKKRLMENNEVKQINLLDSVQTMSHQIRSSMSDLEILSIYQTGLKTIKQIHSESSMSLDNVRKVIDETHIVFDQQNELETMISEALGTSKSSEVDQSIQNKFEELNLDQNMTTVDKEKMLLENWLIASDKRLEVSSNLEESIKLQNRQEVRETSS